MDDFLIKTTCNNYPPCSLHSTFNPENAFKIYNGFESSSIYCVSKNSFGIKIFQYSSDKTAIRTLSEKLFHCLTTISNALSGFKDRDFQIKCIILIPVIITLLILQHPFTSESAEKEQEPDKALRTLIKDMEKTRDKIKRRAEEETSILSKLNNLDKTMYKIKREIEIYDYNLKKAEKEMRDTCEQLIKVEEEINKGYSKLKKRLRGIYKSGGIGLIKLLTNTASLSETLNSITMMRYIARYDAGLIAQMQKAHNEILKARERVKDYQNRVNKYKKQTLEKRQDLTSEQRKREAILKSVREDKGKQSALLKEMEKRSKELRNIIERGSWTDAKTGFRRFKGKLSWPVKGKVVASFGFFYDKVLSRKRLNNGISISSPIGTEIKSVASGKIIYADWFSGYGKLVIINHGEGYTTVYGHTSDIFVKEGQMVEKGQKVAVVGDTDSFRGPELYFELRYNGQPVDPIRWLKRQ